MGKIYKRGRVYWGYWIDERGKRHRRSLTTRDAAVARERLRGHELAATPTARYRPQKISVAIGRMISALHDKSDSTIEMYQEKGRRIVATAGDVDIAKIDRQWLLDYIAARGAEKAARHTIKKELITIRKALTEAHVSGGLPVLPAFPKYSPRYVPRKVFLTPDEFGKLLPELEPKRQAWVALACQAGLRAGEVERMQWSMIRGGVVYVPGSKTPTATREVPVTEALAAILRPLVPGSAGADGPVAEAWPNVRRDLAAACARAGVKKVSPNDLRRTFGTWLHNSGVDPMTIARLMGHKSTAMVYLVYGQTTPATLRAAMDRMPICTPGVSDTRGKLPTPDGSGESDGGGHE